MQNIPHWKDNLELIEKQEERIAELEDSVRTIAGALAVVLETSLKPTSYKSLTVNRKLWRGHLDAMKGIAKDGG